MPEDSEPRFSKADMIIDMIRRLSDQVEKRFDKFESACTAKHAVIDKTLEKNRTAISSLEIVNAQEAGESKGKRIIFGVVVAVVSVASAIASTLINWQKLFAGGQ